MIQMGGLGEPVGEKVKNKIMNLLNSGVRNRRDRESCVDEFVRNTV